MRTPTLTDIIGDLRETNEALDATDVDFGDDANTNVEVPSITSMLPSVSYYASAITRTPYARITWVWTAPVMHDEDGNVIDPNDPDILDDVTFDPVVDYMFGTANGGGTPVSFASTGGLTSMVTENHPLGNNVTGTVYAVLKSGIVGPKYSVTATVSKDTTAPNKPSTPTITTTAATVSVIWDGLDYLGAAQPSDYMNTIVYADTTVNPTTQVGQLDGRGICTFYATPGTTVYVKLVSQDMSYNQSTASTVVSIVSKSILDDTDLGTVLANKAVIYSQNADPTTTLPAGTVKNGDWWFQMDATITSKVISIYKRVSGSWVQDTIHAAAVIAAQSIVAGNLAADSVVADKIKAGEIYSKLTTTGELKADAIRTGLMSAILTISGLFTTSETGTGSRVEINASGITLYRYNATTGNDDVYVNIPVTGDASFYGNLNATGLTVYGIMSLRSPGNTVEAGATLVLNTGIIAPATAPVVTNVYDTYTLVNVNGNAPVVKGGCQYSTYDLTLEQLTYSGTTNGFWINQHNSDGTYNRGAFLKNSLGVNMTYPTLDGTIQMIDNCALTAFGGYLYGLGFNTSTSGDRSVDLYLYKWVWSGGVTDGNFVAAYHLTSAPSSVYGLAHALANDGTYVYLTYVLYSNQKLALRRMTTTGTLSYSVLTTYPIGYLYSLRGAAIGSFDFGTNYLAVANNGVVQFFSFDSSTITRNTDIEFLTNGVSLGWALSYSASGFYTTEANGTVYFYNGSNVWIGDTTKSHNFVYTFYDSVGTTHESKQSPKLTTNVRKRAKIKISVAGWSSDTSTADSVDSLRYYATTISTYYLQGSTNTGQIILTSITLSGSNPPSNSTFPATTPGSITNPDGSLIISGDGTIISKRIRAKMTKTTSGHNAAGSAYSANTWTQITGFDVTDIVNGLTVDSANGKITVVTADSYDIHLHGRWQSYGSVYNRSLAIVLGTSAPATDSSNILAQVTFEQGGWLINDAFVLDKPLSVGDIVTFWIRSAVSSTFNASNTAIPGWTYVNMVKR